MSEPYKSLMDRIVDAAAARGELDNLAGAGKPLPEQHDPKDALIHRVMTEHRIKPPIVMLKEKIATAQAELAQIADPEDRTTKQAELSDLQMRLAIEIEAFGRYG